VRLRSRKLRQRLEAACLHYGTQRPPVWLPTAQLPSPAEGP